MAESMAHITITGNVGREPETKQVGGNQVTSFSVARNKSRKLPDGTWEKTTYWFSVDCWGPQVPAGIVKGAFVVVSGEFELAFKDGKALFDKNGMPYLRIRTAGAGIVVERKRDGAGYAPAVTDDAAAAPAAVTAGTSTEDDELPF